MRVDVCSSGIDLSPLLFSNLTVDVPQNSLDPSRSPTFLPTITSKTTLPTHLPPREGTLSDAFFSTKSSFHYLSQTRYGSTLTSDLKSSNPTSTPKPTSRFGRLVGWFVCCSRSCCCLVGRTSLDTSSTVMGSTRSTSLHQTKEHVPKKTQSPRLTTQ